MIVRRGSRSAQTPPISTKSVCGRMPAIRTMPRSVGEPPEVEHREGQRDREDAVAEHETRLAPEEERELALAQYRQALPSLTASEPTARAGSARSSRAARARRAGASTVGARSPSLPPVAQVRARERHDERHRVRRVRGVRRAVGLEHLLGVAVVGGHERDAARAARPPPGSRRARHRRPRRPRSRPAARPCARPCRGSRG